MYFNYLYFNYFTTLLNDRQTIQCSQNAYTGPQLYQFILSLYVACRLFAKLAYKRRSSLSSRNFYMHEIRCSHSQFPPDYFHSHIHNGS